MILAALLLLPALAALAAFLLRWDRPRRALLVLTGVGHTGLVAAALHARPAPLVEGWVALDAQGLVFLLLTSLLFLAVSVHAVGYLAREEPGRRRDLLEGDDDAWFSNTPEAVFTGCLLLALFATTLVAASQHLGLQWVAVEASTLASARLIYFHRHRRSLEATFKYLLICSVGIALALLGNFCLAASAERQARGLSLALPALIQAAPLLDDAWLRAAFLFFLVGYGTKVGLAPLHTWLPDAYAEAPSLVSAYLAGSVSSAALLGIVRAHEVCEAAGQGAFSRELLVGFGLLSMFVAAGFIIAQADFKRLLAYSSLEQSGILALGIGLGGAASGGALQQLLAGSLAKAAMFLAAGNLLLRYHTRTCAEVRGLSRALPFTGVLWLGGAFALAGSPPFGTFQSELSILKGALDQGRWGVAAGYLALLAIVFAGMSAIVLPMAQGSPPHPAQGSRRPAPQQTGAFAPPPGGEREPLLSVLPALLLLLLVLVLGVHQPPQLGALIEEAARALGGPA